MKRVVIVHGYQATALSGWRKWLANQLKSPGFQVIAPQLSTIDWPKESEWVDGVAKAVGVSDPDTIFVGHSLGCITILRYLESLPAGQSAGGVVLVAGFTTHLNIKNIKEFYTDPIDWQKIKHKCGKFIVIHSRDDPTVPFKEGQLLAEKLGAQFIAEEGKGHYSSSEGVTDLPAALQAIQTLSEP